ncbi:hypothetical protein MSTO_50370 [Mycobacterium stomatepiae]|uniref:Uncharacterized protein n=1 Tax=Mycobacterium stomatepiae TaxID=470076 RepID=A0A7I7QF97_9MYCO|nr:hypothetical protein MSTO_50370 [Mycobacterium stomatepiae]
MASDQLREFFERARQQGKIRAWGVSQEEGLEADFARAFAPEGVSQLRGDVLDPAPRPADVAFGVLNAPHARLAQALSTNAQLARHWRDTLEIDPQAPGMLAKLILGSSLTATGCRAILYSTTKPQRVTDAASAVCAPPDPEIVTRFLGLVEEFRAGACA